MKDLAQRLPDADVLIVVPPLAHLSWPSLGVHVLQACAEREGFRVGVLYANMLYAARIGHVRYATLANSPWLLGERVFGQAAFGTQPLAPERRDFWQRVEEHNARQGDPASTYLDQMSDSAGVEPSAWGCVYPPEELVRCEREALALCDELGAAVAEKGYSVVGASTTFDQTAAAVALLSRVKEHAPEVVTMIGGANCEGPMADAVATLSDRIDHVFSGESESVFPGVLAALRQGVRPPSVVHGSPCTDLDALPTPSYGEYFEQIDAFLPAMRESPLWLPYESSRGCWWGEKHHCTFCGLNGMGMAYRRKSAERVLDDLRVLVDRYPTQHVVMSDNIMPHEYHRTLVPALRDANIGARVFYEQKANLTLDMVRNLYAAGIETIQPGIESLSTPVLRLMRKGVLARQNVALLRNALAVGLNLKWNLLYGFPGDDAADYEEMARFLPLLRHLQPPNALTGLAIDRFSPYFEQRESFGISDVQPVPVYADVFPPGTDTSRLAYHFTAEYESGSASDQGLYRRMTDDVARWTAMWRDTQPHLRVSPAGAETWVLVDTRDVGGPTCAHLSNSQAAAVLAGGPRDGVASADWAIDNGYALDLDGWCVPLATASADLLADMEKRHRRVAAAAFAPESLVISA